MENKIPNVSSLVKKTDCDTKISELEKKITDHKHGKYITTPEFNKITVEYFAQANLITKTDFNAKLSCLIEKLLQIKQNTYLLKIS